MKFRHVLLLALSLALTLVLGLFFAACNQGDDPTPHSHVDADNNGKCDECGDPMPNENPDPSKTTYTVRLLRSGGDPIARANVVARDEAGGLAAFGTTDTNGVATFTAVKGTYTLDFSLLPDGYAAKETYTVTAENPSVEIKFSASVIMTPMDNGQTYTLGSVMHNFSFIDSTGVSSSLAALLETKKAVLLNFWGVNCTWCVREFPAMKSAYEQYEDSVAVVALSSYSGGESSAEVEEYRRLNNLPFHMVGNDIPCTYALTSAFGVQGFPTSVLIDREGVVCFIAEGGGDEDGFLSIFEKFTAEPYVQDIVYPDEQQEQQRPNVQAPASSEIETAVNDTASGYDASYYFTPKGEEAAHEYNWPWVVGEDADGKYIHPANAGYNGSFAMLYSDVTVSAGQVIAFDYKVSTESNADFFYVFIDSVQMFALSGIDTGWHTLYAYVPLEAGTYRLCLAYVKDSSDKSGDDTVYVKNLRFTETAEIDSPTELTYRCATGTILNNKYSKYITPIFSEKDGYYHVGTEDGPLVLADLMNATNWSNRNAYSYVQNGGFLFDLDGDGTAEDLTNRFTYFCQYANNARPYGYVAVTAEIKQYLDAFTTFYSDAHHENEWLELCSYIARYGFSEGEGELEDPARGLTDYNAFPAVENKGTEKQPNGVNHVVIDRVVMPRGFWFKFVPETTGVYRVRSLGDFDTYGWVRDEDLNVIAENDEAEGAFDPGDIAHSDGNFVMTLLMEEGRAYYIACAFFGIEDLGSYDFIITNLGVSGDFWTAASRSEYTWDIMRDENGNPVLDANGEPVLGDIVLRGAIEVRLGDLNGTQCYFPVLENGELAEKPVYINLAGDVTTAMFPDLKIEAMVNIDVHYCPTCGYTVTGSKPSSCDVCGSIEPYETRKAFDLPTPLRDQETGLVLTENFTVGEDGYSVPLYERDADGKIAFTDYTDTMKAYIDRAKTEYPIDDEGERFGFTAATEELVDILTKFIVFGDYAMTPNVPNAWLLLASYYLHLGA